MAIFAKTPRPGRVKTRLIGSLTPEQAADLHQAFLDDLVAEMRAGRFDVRLAWALEPGESVPPGPVGTLTQSGGDLGHRLFDSLSALVGEFPRVAAVGSDHPTLTVSHVHRAFDKLTAGADVVLGPAGDGGYYLIGVRREALKPEIFAEIPWSSDSVLRATMERCRRLHLRVSRLPLVPDVDTPSDLGRLIRTLERSPEPRCPRTRQLLRSWQRRSGQGVGGTHHESP